MLRRTTVWGTYRTIAERFWAPFTQGLRGPDTSDYKTRENLAKLIGWRRPLSLHSASTAALDGIASGDSVGSHSGLDSSTANTNAPPLGTSTPVANPFTCQVNHAIGDAETMENMFITILTGFDIVRVILDPSPESSNNFRGTIFVHHCRPFLGWEATNATLFFPFSMFIEGDAGQDLVSHIVLHFYFDDALRNANCPAKVLEILGDRDALKTLAALRKVRVKPEAITPETLASTTKESALWRKAMEPRPE